MHFRVIWGYLLFWITGDNQELIVVNYSCGRLNGTSPKVQLKVFCVLIITTSTFFFYLCKFCDFVTSMGNFYLRKTFQNTLPTSLECHTNVVLNSFCPHVRNLNLEHFHECKKKKATVLITASESNYDYFR